MNIEALPVLTNEQVTANAFAKFKRAVQFEVVLDEMVSDVNQAERPIHQDWIDTTLGLRNVVRTALFYSRLEIKRFGTREDNNQADDVLNRLDIFQQHNLLSADIVPPKSMVKELADFGTEQAALDYENKYLR